MYNKVELCGVNTAELPVLSEQEKRQLLTRARAGDQSARQSMIEGNLRLVLSVVQRFAQRGENLDDLFQVGCIGLIKAIDNFDPAQEVRFSTYGVPMIIGEIRRFLRDNNAPACGIRPTGPCRAGSSWKRNWAGSRPWRRSPGRPGCPAGKWRRLWNRWWSPSASKSRSIPMAGTPCM